jgi:hypothetical protein
LNLKIKETQKCSVKLNILMPLYLYVYIAALLVSMSLYTQEMKMHSGGLN